MFGCVRRLGCLVLLLVLGVAAFLTRDRWSGYLHRDRGVAAPAGPVWEPLTDAGAQRARVIVESLGQRSGPVFANVRAGDLASYIFIALAKQLPPSAEHTQAAVIGDRLYVKSLVKLSDFGGAGALGPLAGFLAERDTVRFGGTFEMIRPGLAQFHVHEIRIHDLSVPRALIPKLVGTMGRGARPAGTAPDALPLATPPYVGDVRVGQGRVTLYTTVP